MSYDEAWRSELTELELVDEIARMRRHIAMLADREHRMAEILASRMRENGLDRLEGRDYSCRLIEGERLRINPARLFERVRREDFFSAVTVSSTEARRLLGEADLRAIAELVPIRQLRIEPTETHCRDPKPGESAKAEPEVGTATLSEATR